MTWILPKQLHTLACALDTAALSLDSNESSRICAQSLFVRSKPLPLRTWSARWKRDSWTRHLSGRILEPSLGERFTEKWTSLLAVTHASPLATQESGQARKIRGIYGRGSQMEFDFSGHDAASLKTSKDISAWGCPTSSKTWQDWVTERRGAYSARLKSALHTSGSECSSWPTSSARDWKGCYTTLQRKDGKMRGDLLPDAVNIEEMHGPPVPASSSTDGSRQESWATPIMGDSHLASTPGAAQKRLDEGKVTLSRQNPGKLNPRWVETLMGLPVGWTMPSCVSPVTIGLTSCGSSATESCQQPPSGPSEC